MNEPLQQFDWKSSNYERPGDDWVCGKACSGERCHFGPTADGECKLETRCEPEKSGDRYKCARSAVNGGKCSDGPNPDGTCCQADESCQPLMSRGRRRKMAGITCVILSAAVCLIAIAPTDSQSLLSPGSVTTAHAGIEANCSSCHQAAELESPLTAAFHTRDPLADSHKCLDCHTNLGSDPFSAHSVGGGLLNERTEGVASMSGSPPWSVHLASWLDPAAAERELACSTCHTEHHGRSFDLQKISDQQCQTCHKNQFADFSHGHPEFKEYPHETRPRLYFDHARHMEVYFHKSEFQRLMPNGEVPKNCLSCHEQDAGGAMMIVKGFETTCASCHESQIVDIDFPGIPFVALPRIDAEATDSESAGHWPTTESSLRQVPPFMSLLLQEDRQRDASENGHSQDMQLSIRRMLFEFQSQGEFALQSRLAPQFSEVGNAVRTISPVIAEAAGDWFPMLAEEMAALNAGTALPESSASSSTSDASPMPAVRGWYISHADKSIRYRPTGHADSILRELIDSLVSGDSSDARTEKLLDVLANPSGSGEFDRSGPLASGRCLSCHTVDRNAVGRSVVNWTGKRPDGQSAFTKFRHAPHTQGSDEKSCLRCHELSGAVAVNDAFRTEFFNRDSRMQWHPVRDSNCPQSSGLRPLSRAHCASCHNDSQSSQSCLECHNYHIHSP